jgi:hypothetical protein
MNQHVIQIYWMPSLPAAVNAALALLGYEFLFVEYSVAWKY